MRRTCSSGSPPIGSSPSTRTAGSGSAWTPCASAISSKNCGKADGHPGSDGHSRTRRTHALPVVRHRRHHGNPFARLAAAAERLSAGERAGGRAALSARGRVLSGLLAGAAAAHRAAGTDVLGVPLLLVVLRIDAAAR